MKLDKYIGNKMEYAFEHRLLNTILIYGILISAGTILVNYLLELGWLLIGLSGGSCMFFGMLYYLSMKCKVYRAVAILLIGVIFVITPIMWIANGGLFGGCTFYIVLFSAIVAILLRGRARIGVAASLTLMTSVLILIEYQNPGVIVGYNSPGAKYADVSVGLLIVVVANTLIFVQIINQYIDEHTRANQYLGEIEEQKIDSLNQKFVGVFNASPSLMAICREKDFCYLAVNDAWLEALGYTREEVIGRMEADLNILMQDDREVVLHDHATKKMAEMQVRTKQGEARYWLMSKAKLKMDGEACMLLASIDRTAMNHLERKIAHLDRLNLIGEIAASIGHEIRNPLTTVRGFLQLFQKKREYYRDKENVDMMIEELDRANSIITEFLSLAKNRIIDLKTLDLNQTMEGLYPLIYATAVLEGTEVSLKLDSRLPKILADENEIRQLVLNLARNSLEAMPDGGKIILSTRLEKAAVVLSVQDTGCGIPREIFEKIGMPFQTTKDNGTGLGLAVCYRVAQRHNANIEVDTGALGTTFSVRFSIPESSGQNAAGIVGDFVSESDKING